MRNSLLLLFFAAISFLPSVTQAGTVDTIVTHSMAMHKDVKAVVVTPQSYSANKQYPVVYLLHVHQQLLYRNITHDYISRPGGHDWNYFGSAVIYHLLFFKNFFAAGQSK